MLDFISNLYKRTPRPSVQEPGVTQFIEELPADNPAVALEELTHWMLALSTSASLDVKERVKRLSRIDHSAQKYERALRRRYTDTSRMYKAFETRIWNASFDFLEASVNAHFRCITNLPQKSAANDKDIAFVIARAIRRLDLQMHWLNLRYRPIPASLWDQIFALIKLAEERALLNAPIKLNNSAKTDTTLVREFLKLLMMAVAAPTHLTKTQIDLARLLTHNLAGDFCWEALPRGSTVFHLDFSKPLTPLRLSKVSDHPFMSRCFASGAAISALVTGLKQLEQGEVPTSLGAIEISNYKREDLLEVVAHLCQCWCNMDARTEPPPFDNRHAKRTQVFYQISVVHSFNFLCDQLTQSAVSAELNYGKHETESWVVENISQMGYGVTIASVKEDWVRDHTVVGIQPDFAPWQIGVIRRVASESIESTRAGIQILSNLPHAALLRTLDEEMSIRETAADIQTCPHTPGIMLLKEPPYQDAASLLLAAGSYQLHHPYALIVGEEKRTIQLLDRINTFQGVDQLSFEDVKSKT